jgi:hypothetical protein
VSGLRPGPPAAGPAGGHRPPLSSALPAAPGVPARQAYTQELGPLPDRPPPPLPGPDPETAALVAEAAARARELLTRHLARFEPGGAG